MFGKNERDSIVQRGIDEALACRDMLAREPVKPAHLVSLLARLMAVVRALALRGPGRQREIAPVATLEVTR